MKKEQLIKELEKLPKGTDVCIFDWRKNSHHVSDEPCGMGIESDFEMEYVTENVSAPFAALYYLNDDYKKDGTPNYGASIMQYTLND